GSNQGNNTNGSNFIPVRDLNVVGTQPKPITRQSGAMLPNTGESQMNLLPLAAIASLSAMMLAMGLKKKEEK
ncbi:MAG: LPXTG cell wall anchor domain-containing protein, partial [Aerococcaceae bacterium]|nr:LPXTG cell wall anchor domain-containing protein [Aerococcaceae bacterium]